MDRQAYLQRIGWTGPVGPNLDTLRRLHHQHLLTVPFENIDIHLGRPLSLDLPALFDKIVTRRRGGFCYELNGLFAWLLRDIGFRVDLLSARVVGESGDIGPEFDHMVLLVRLDQRWLADVGFGDGFLRPLCLDSDAPHVEGDTQYRVVDRDGDPALERKLPGDHWALQYLFSFDPHPMDDYEGMCSFHQTSPQSPFTRKRLCTVATPIGRLTLTEKRLIETTQTSREETILTGDAHWEEVLLDRFGVNLY
jgi:N-hydroxyarylamine O-acetyltransferase